MKPVKKRYEDSVVALKRRVEELAMCAERDAQIVKEAVGLAARERVEAAEKGATSPGPTSWQRAHSGTSKPVLSRST